MHTNWKLERCTAPVAQASVNSNSVRSDNARPENSTMNKTRASTSPAMSTGTNHDQACNSQTLNINVNDSDQSDLQDKSDDVTDQTTQQPSASFLLPNQQ